MQAIGLIEVIGYPAAIEGADAALKAANIKLNGLSKVGSGIMTVILYGDVGAVKAAVESGSLAASKIGTLRASHIIPRVDNSLIGTVLQPERKLQESQTLMQKEADKVNNKENIIKKNDLNTNLPVATFKAFSGAEISEKSVEQMSNNNQKDTDSENSKTTQVISENVPNKDSDSNGRDMISDLRKKTNQELKGMVRALGVEISADKLKAAKKEELIQLIEAYSRDKKGE